MSDQMIRRLVTAGRKVPLETGIRGDVEVGVTTPDPAVTVRGHGATVLAALSDAAQHDGAVGAIVWPVSAFRAAHPAA